MSGPLHLVRRFLGSLSPRPLDRRDAAWVEDVLSSEERALWAQLPRADRKHAAGVAREVDRRLDGASRPLLAAALLHDVGKIRSGFGTFGRSVATVVGIVVGRDRVRGRVALYLHHDQLGAALLEAAGSDPVAVAWAREHHLPPERWSVPADVGAVLSAADDD